MLDDTVIIALVPGCVEVAKRSGLPPRMAPIAALAIATLLVTLSHLAGDPDPLTVGVPARLLLTGLIDGLAAIGLYRVVPRTGVRGQGSVGSRPKTQNPTPKTPIVGIDTGSEQCPVDRSSSSRSSCHP